MARSACNRNEHEQRPRATRRDGVRRGRGRRRARPVWRWPSASSSSAPISRCAFSRRARPSARTPCQARSSSPALWTHCCPHGAPRPCPSACRSRATSSAGWGARARPGCRGCRSTCTTTAISSSRWAGWSRGWPRRPRNSASTCSRDSPPPCRCSTMTARWPACRSATWGCSTMARVALTTPPDRRCGPG